MAGKRADGESALVTGGAGFIGSHLVRRLVAEGYQVRVLDNLSTGKEVNLAGIEGVQFVDGDICAPDVVAQAMEGIDTVFHLAALPSVARSWKDPVATLATNAHGTANVVEAAVRSKASKLVYSSSSSVYGDQQAEVKSEDLEPRPVSPYAYSKLLAEKIALAHSSDRGGLQVIALRYFNVFGPRQDPDSPYAAVIPLFIKHAIEGTAATIYGDGSQTRDFTHVSNVVEANLCAARSEISGVALNIACGESHTILELVDGISGLAKKPLRTVLAPRREGDITHSLADISLAAATIGYRPQIQFFEGLRRTFDEFTST